MDKIVFRTYVVGFIGGVCILTCIDGLYTDFIGKEASLELLSERKFLDWWPWAVFLMLFCVLNILFVAASIRDAKKYEQRSNS